MRRAPVAPALVIVLATCAPPTTRTTFLQSADLVEMTDRMAESFAHDAALGGRRPDGEPWVISVHRVVNHTNQIIPEREKWLYVGRLRARLARSDLSERYNLIWVIPPERWPLVAEDVADEEPYGLRMNPTHLLTAEFYALTNTSGRGRSDTYVCSFQLLEIGGGRLVWEDAWEVKRAREGLTYD